MKNLNLAILTCALTLTGCNSTPITSESRINTQVAITQYNSIASKYYDQPTFAKLMDIKNTGEILTYTAEKYGEGSFKLSIHKEDIPVITSTIDKYLKWEETASKDGDIFTKEITPPYESKVNSANMYSWKFYSGNAKSHFLIEDTCMWGKCTSITLNRTSAINLKSDLLKWSNGELSSRSAENTNKYN
jgi:hypothetical protein|tara:strand:- start:863 stop:1429 length:567 start_codon:yes stop_codon:yes gene_type:complete